MASSELLKSWELTEELLAKARALLSVDVVLEHDAALLQMAEFLDHNELGLAFDWLKSIAQESQWECIELLDTLRLAAKNMGLAEEVDALSLRILELG